MAFFLQWGGSETDKGWLDYGGYSRKGRCERMMFHKNRWLWQMGNEKKMPLEKPCPMSLPNYHNMVMIQLKK